jgi:hypothetical protein
MTALREIVALLAAALVVSAAYAQSTDASKPAKAAKQAHPGTIDFKRDMNQAWSEMRRAPAEIGKGVPAAGREAGRTFSEAGRKARDGFTGKTPPTIPDPPK